jgi:hypothetical protein
MKLLLTCSQCEYQTWGRSGSPFINKVIMWNHFKKAHPGTAERIMRMYQMVPNHLFHTHSALSS